MNPSHHDYHLDDEYEYEYEYDTNETETFYVDLDLSSLNSGQKPTVNNSSRSRKGPVSSIKKRELSQSAEPDEASPNAANPDGDDETATRASPSGATSVEDVGTGLGAKLEILDINTINPIVAYKGHVFSCTWADMVGTNMFFSQPQAVPDAQPLRSTDDYDLIATSRIKLVGQRASLKNIPVRKRRRLNQEENDEDSASEVKEGRSLGTMYRSNPKVNIQLKNQAAFLDRLMDIKQSRGEQDLVRTYADERVASSIQAQMSETTLRKIDSLNRKVVKGDAEALQQLQKVYTRLDDKAIEST
ncbi:hypothetical protein PV10_04416 [Exophiala mesophila]|uniref:Transcription factor TFIIIC triple barrel domain-containing protein n=1 Tax=Exophiala mesophila TaxID=212818 RepID=A0A0D1ZH92_EXOME|nr:uncharacterized protein PV10_04416 [Exophiala mesophila]KIV93179.1 hypothetical protein PV10_04416 [Exophiala mesophila]